MDAGRFLPHIPPHHFPAQALTAALYERAGVRAVEIGSSCFGHVDEATGRFVPARLELMRLALPRRVYTDGHLAYVAEALCRSVSWAHTCGVGCIVLHKTVKSGSC